jgi:glycosyltransferase involved in cell wall biosynthesis
MINARVAILTNFIPPYRIPFLQLVSGAVRDLQIFISTPMEPNRSWPANWEDLSVRVQNTLTISRTWRHPSGFSEALDMHIPYDTILILHKYKPDVIVSGELGFRSLQSALYSILHPGSRLILWCTLSERSEQGRGRIRDIFRQWLLPRAHAILVNGESGARYVKQFGISDSRIFRIGQTPPIDNFTRMPISHSRMKLTRVLIVGSLVERKGIIPFVDCLRNWLHAHSSIMVEVICAGEGPLRHQLEKLILPPNLQLSLLGNINYEEMPVIYANADILAFPTLADEWGLVVNEALAVGMPVLGSLYSQAVEELIVNQETGWTFHPDNKEEMTQAIDQALSVAPEQLVEMRSAARNKAIKNGPSTMTYKFIQAIEFVLR